MGRPKGSRNKRTLGVPGELAEVLRQRDPADVLSSYYSMPLDELKRLVRSKAGAAAVGIHIRAAEAAMPYVHSKMPIAMTVNEQKLPALVILQKQGLMKDVTPTVAGEPVAGEAQRIEAKGDKHD